MKTILTAIAALAIILGTASCSKENPSPKTYRVATECTFPPFEFYVGNKVMSGFDIDLLNAIAEEMGFNVEYVDMPFEKIIDSVTRHDVDMAAAALTVTPERERKVLFSSDYIEDGQAITASKSVGVEVFTIFDTMGTPICAEAGSTGATILERANHPLLVRCENNAEINKKFNEGQCQMIMRNRSASRYALRERMVHNARILGMSVTNNLIAFAVNKKEKELLGLIDEGMERLRQNGQFDAIHSKWFGSAESVDSDES